MKLLLINSNRFKQPFPIIPVGMCWVAAAVEEAGHEVSFLDLTFAADGAADPVALLGAEISAAIDRFGPDAIGIGVRNIDNGTGYNTRFLLEEVKVEVTDPCKALFNGPIVIGGSAVGINGSEMLDFFDLDYAIRGDGEEAMAEFMTRLAEGRPFQGMKGLVIHSDGKIVQDFPGDNTRSLDDLPLARPHRYLDLKPYARFDAPLQIQTKRGCALSCTYCIYNVIEGRRYRYRDPEAIAAEIETLHRETGIDRFEFTDSTFNIPLKHGKEVLKAVIARGLDLRLSAMGLSPRGVDAEFVDLLEAAGFMAVDLGVEAGNETTLKSLGKNFGVKHIMTAGENLHRKHIPITWHLLLGAPGETPETLKETFATLDKAAAPWDFVNIGVGIRVYKDSPMARSIVEGGIPGIHSRDGFLSPINYQPEALDLDTVKILTRRAALSRPNFFLYDEDEEKVKPESLERATKFLMRFAPKQPVWRFYILGGWVGKLSGLRLIRRLRFEWTHRALLRSISRRKHAVAEELIVGKSPVLG